MTCAHGMPSPASCVECMEDVGLGPPRRAPLTVETTFKARYDGQCHGCNLPIMVGQVVHRLSNDSYVHDGCQP